jgi:hypothetical protein
VAGAALLSQPGLTAVFKSTVTGPAQHWELYDLDGQLVGRTKRTYRGNPLARGVRRVGTLLDWHPNKRLNANVLDAGGAVVARLFSTRADGDPRVEVSDPGGTPIGTVRRKGGVGLSFEDAAGAQIAQVPITADGKPWEIGKATTEPWPLLDAHGEQIGELKLETAVRAEPQSLGREAVELANLVGGGASLTRHLGFAGSQTYGATLAALPASEPLRTLAVLMPVIAGHSY